MTNISANAQKIIEGRYSQKDETGKPTESWGQIVNRVVDHVFSKDEHEDIGVLKQQMKSCMRERKFIPNTPCLVNAGKKDGMLAACFVLPVPDSIEGIMDHAKVCATIHRTGGGTGMSYEFIRPEGTLVNSTHGVASGPVSFMNIVNETTNVIKQGGVRRGANMGIMSVHHPDILKFIHAKNNQTSLTNFNISVTVTDEFMKAVEDEAWYDLKFNGKNWDEYITDPLTKDTYELNGGGMRGKLYAPEVWERIIKSAHQYAEPGVIFIDEVNRHNHMKTSMGPIVACNPCGEQFLHSNNSCNLGSIDVSKFYDKGWNDVQWDDLRTAVWYGVRFLDNVIDTCQWPTLEIEDTVKRTRPVGLGIMGFADLCLKLGIRYGSDECLEFVENLLRNFRVAAWSASIDLGEEKGTFPEFKNNEKEYLEFFDRDLNFKFSEATQFEEAFRPTPRNYQVTNIAPTGTISLVAETSSGIEPNFSWAYVRRDTVGERYYVHPLAAEALGITVDWEDPASVKAAAEQAVEFSYELPDYFVTAMELDAVDHVKVLAAAQKHIDNSISKTCNGKADDTVESVDNLYRMARNLGCKAVSYYRDGSREGQVLTEIKKEEKAVNYVSTGELKSSDYVLTTTPLTQEVYEIKSKRPPELQGYTWQINFEGRKLYVTVNHDGEKVREIFTLGPISESVGLLASKMLRGGFSANDVARILNKVEGVNSVWFNKRCLSSLEQAVAECLYIAERRLEAKPDSTKVELTVGKEVKWPEEGRPYFTELKQCPECKGNMESGGGCDFCRDCGYSKCK